MLTNHAGVIDSGYRGEVMAKFRSTTDVVPAVYKPGEKFAQLLILPAPDVTFTEALELSNSERGEGGYGSTGATIQNESAPTATTEPQNTDEIKAQQPATEVAAGEENTPEQA